MLGKVMDGQTGALSKQGYNFTKAQEKILKYGNEAQRAAVLADVINNSIDGVNEALADTPEGKLKQQANNLETIQQRIGKLWVTVKGSLSGVFESLMNKLDSVVSWFEKNRDRIITTVQNIANFVIKAFNGIWKVIKKAADFISFLWKKFEEGNPIVYGAAVVLGSLILAVEIMTVRAKILSFWKSACAGATFTWAGAMNALNLAFLANPITWIIAGIVALIAVIAYVCYKVEGWGTLWDGIIGFMKYGFLAFVESIRLYWSTWFNAFLRQAVQ
jgi:phage-related protein